MAPPGQYESPFPQIHLSLDERAMLVHTATDLLSQAQDKYEWFLWQDRERLDPDRWSLVREREEMRVYVDRLLPDESGNRDMQLLLTTGSVPGTLHDAMYGILNPTTEAMKVKTAYMQDTLLDGAVLETILEPTTELPFQSLTLRWFAKGVPLPVRAVTKKHGDNVSIEATGMRQLYDGEQVGFHLMQSVILAEAPPLPQYQRCNFSICTFWRQMTPKLVQVYMTSYIELPELFMIPFQVKSMADAFVSGSKSAHCARMKKLAWLMQQNATTKQLDESGNDQAAEKVGKAGCSSCGSLCPCLSFYPTGCAVCFKPVCANCRVKHELFSLGSDRELIKTKVRVCVPCMKYVDGLDSAVVAQYDAMTKEQPHQSELTGVSVREQRLSTTSSVTSSVSSENGVY